MSQIISALSGHEQFTVGFLDSRLRHFGAYSKGMLPSGAAANIATTVVEHHQADQNIFATLTAFVNNVQHEAGGASGAAAASAPSHVLRNVLIAFGIVFVVVMLGFFLIARPIRRRRQRELEEARSAAQDDLIALSAGVTGHHADVSIQGNPDAAEEQGAALSAYERGTAALDAAKRATDMGAVSRAIAEGQYHLACAEALAAGQPKPDRRPSCFFDPRHGMSVSDVHWTPAEGGPGRSVPACSACAHKVEQGIEPDMRKVEATAPRSATSTPASPRRTGAATALAPACSPGFCSERRSHPTPALPTAIPPAGITAVETPVAGTSAAGTLAAGTPAAGTPAAGTPAAGTPAAGTSAAGTRRGLLAAGTSGGGDFGGGDFGGGGNLS